jgi:ribosome biogenesis protein NSA1
LITKNQDEFGEKMRIITGDECGMIKLIYLNDVKTIGTIDKKKLICCMSLDKNILLICRENGQIDLLDIDTLEWVYTKELYTEKTNFVGCHLIKGVIITCTDKGMVHYIHWSGEETLGLPEVTINLGQDRLFRMRIHPSDPHKFATGGEERELCLWDIKNAGEKMEPVWKAKNVPNDYLDMRVKVWVTDIQFLNDNHILIGSGYQHVRVYDISGQRRRPTTSFSVGEYPIKSICTYEKEYILSDSSGKVVSIDSASGTITGAFKGIAGTVVQVSAAKDQVITVGLDRHVRIYSAKEKHSEIKKLFMKHRLTCFVVDEEYTEEVEPDEWKDIPQVVEDQHLEKETAMVKKKKRSDPEETKIKSKKKKI